MPNVEVQVPAAIGDQVLIRADSQGGQVGLVTAWRVVRSRFLAGGLLDGTHQVSLQVLTEQGDERWLGESEVTSFGARDLVTFSLPFVGGDTVLIRPCGAEGEVHGWQVTGRQLGVEMVYRVHLVGAAAGEEVLVEANDLVLQAK